MPHGLVHHHPPHAEGRNGLVAKLAKSTIITSCIAGTMLLGGIPLTTVLPTSAPIWMGFATLVSSN